MHRNFVVVPIVKAIRNITLVCKRFYASLFAGSAIPELKNGVKKPSYGL